MCVKIINPDSEVKYNSAIPLEEQIKASKRVRITYEKKDPDIDKFLCEMERLCRNGTSIYLDVEVLHNNQIKGARANKQMKRLMKDLNVNEAIKLLVKLQRVTDITLGELADYCQKR